MVLLVGILALSSAGRPSVVSAGINVWTTNGPEGGNIKALAIDPSALATLYAGTYENGVFKSTDGGATWSPANTGLTDSFVLSLAIDPVTPATLYAGTALGVSKSTDGGANWSLASTGLTSYFVRALAIDPVTPATLYAGTADGVFKSTDGGANWSLASTGLTYEVWALAIDPVTPATLYAASWGGGVSKTTDGGGNWNPANAGLTYLWIRSLAIDPLAPATLYAGTYCLAGTDGGVLKSTDGGANWSALNVGLTSSVLVQALAIDPVTPATLFAGTDSAGVFKSTDGGTNWGQANTGLASLSVSAVAIHPAAPATVYAGTDGSGVSRSTNGGANWSTYNAGLMAAAVYALAIDPSAPATLYAGTLGGGVSKSADGGGSWNPANTGLASLHVDALALHPSAPATLYTGTYGGGVFKSTNGGGSWSPANTGLTKLDVAAVAIDPATPETLYAGTAGGAGIFKSTDGGASWSPANTGLGHTHVIDLAIDPVTPATLYAGTYGGGLFKSTDGGGSWGPASTGLTSDVVNAVAIDPMTPATLYAGTEGGLFKSTDGGANWNPANTGLTNPIVRALAIDPSTPATLYAGTWGGGVFKSTDGGANWSAFNDGLTERRVNYNALAIDPVTPARLHVGTYGDGVFDIQQLEQVVYVEFDADTAAVAEDAGSASLTVRLTSAPALTVTVDYEVSGGTATGGGEDYTLAAGSLTFDPGETTGTIVATIADDVEYEHDETVVVTLSNPQNAALGLLTSMALTIEDDDEPPQVGFDAAAAAVPEDAGTVSLTVRLSATSGLSVTVDYDVSWGTATGGGVDYTLAAGSLIIDSGQTTATIGVTIVDDDEHEPDEVLEVALIHPQNATLGPQSSTTLTIEDNDPDTTPPDPPVLLSPPDGTTTSDDTPALVWQPSPSFDAVGYLVDFGGTVTDVGNVTHYVITPALATGTYTWTVAAYDGVPFTSTYPAAWSFTVDPTHTPQVVEVQPAANSHTATVATDLTVTVNDIVSPTTVTTQTMSVHGGFRGHLAGSYHFSDIVFEPANDFYPGELVEISVTDGVQAGKKGVTPYVWQFRAGVAGGDVRFSGGWHLSYVGAGIDVDLGDLNGDGHLDAFVRRWAYPHLVCLNDGTGAFGPSCQSLSSPNTNAIALGDLDGDRDLDVFLARGDLGALVAMANEVWLNQGGTQGGVPATFARGWTQSAGLSVSTAVALGDLDGDGALDAFIGTSFDEASRVWLNDGTGTFGAGWVEGSDPLDLVATEDVALGDLDGDGDLDAFAGTSGLNRVWVNEGGAQAGTMGTFGAGWEQTLNSADTLGVALGDLDGDGHLDALTANYQSADVIWRNDADGNFSRIAFSPETLTSLSQAAALGDLDGDGDLDAYVANWWNLPDQVWRNEGNLAFIEVQGLDPGISAPGGSANSEGVALGDLDGDGDLDAFVVAGANLRVWRNQDASVPSSGGSVTPAPGVTITVPGGAFTDTVVLNFVPHPITNTGSLQHVGFFYELDCTYLSSGELASLQPGQRYTITVTYEQADVPPGVNEADLALYYVIYYVRDRPVWKKEPTSVVDTVANTIIATPDHFSLWGLLESKYFTYLPLAVRSN
jgi:photosystem II stability/assembly factor-like uncharacterized protein